MFNIRFYITLYIIILYFSYFNIIYINSFLNRIITGSVYCRDEGFYKKCIYNNIYYYNNKWIIYLNNANFNIPCVNIYAKKLSNCWKPSINSFNQQKSNYLHIYTYVNGVSVPFKLTYNKNYGHALWDDLYSIYTSLVKFGLKNYPFNLIISHYNIYYNPNFLSDIYNVVERFSKGKNIYLEKYRNRAILFEKLIVGSSHQCQRCVTLDYSLKYSREYNITKLVRDRMYEVYNIKTKNIYPIIGIIVHNKRYSEYEISVLKSIVEYYQKNILIKLYYIDYRNITTFKEQLRLLSNVHIYISGPGTGLLNFPFIADPGVVINIGHIHFGCPQYLEQYILEGTPHYKALYYPPKLRMQKLNFTYLIALINEAVKYISMNRTIYMKKGENLNDIGKLYVKICKDHKKLCEKLINMYDWGYGKCRGIWAENVIYFPSLYDKIPELKKVVSLYNLSYELGCRIGIGRSKQSQCNK